MIPREKIDDVRERTNLVEVVRRHVELKRAGTGSWKGLCPFHAEKTPSFYVHDQRQFFHCFGCDEKGDVFTFLTKIEQRSFMEVLRDLAQLAGVDLPEKQLTPGERKAQAEAESERERMLRTVEVATAFFEEQLAAPGGAAARAYLESRGLSAETQRKFRVGYAPASWDALQRHLADKPIPLSVAEQVGLVGVGDRGRYDFFRDRVMLPVLDRQKRPVGFSSRLLDPEAKDRKYINSPDSPLFHKKENLYGLHAALDAIRRSGLAVIVEGNFDVMSLHHAGVEEAVAPMGTALTAEQVAAVARVARRVVVVFDGDEAGQRAARKTLPLFLEAEVDGRVARMPPGVDPDDFVRTRGAEAFRSLVDGARPVVEQFIDDLARGIDAGIDETGRGGTTPGRVGALEAAAPILARVRSPAARELYAGRLAAALGISMTEVARAIRGAAAAAAHPTPATSGISTHTVSTNRRTPPKEQLEALVLLVTHPELAPLSEAQRVLELLVDPGVSQIYRTALDSLRRGERVDIPAWLDAGPAEIREAVGSAVMHGAFSGSEGADRALRAIKTRLELSRVVAEIEEMKSARSKAQKQGDSDAVRELTRREMELIRTREGLSNALARP